MEAVIGLAGFTFLIWLMFGGMKQIAGWLTLGPKKTTHGLHSRGKENARTDGD